jgi:hypothetical protein
MSSRDSMALIYLIIGALMTAAFIYKIWVSPPGSSKIGGVGGLGGIDASDLFKSLGIDMKPSYGAYVGIVGSLFFTAGSFLEFRAAGMAKSAPPVPQAFQPQQQQAAPGAQRYQAPAPQAHAPDPFAVPPQQQAAAGAAVSAPRQVAPDPFAPPPAPPAA